MSDLTKALQTIAGFGEKESAIYLALLALGEGTVIEIASTSSVKRTTVYNLLPTMVQRGLVQSSMRGGKTIYFVDDTRSLQTQLEERESLLASVLPQLQAMHNILPQKPKITFYEGVEGMKEMYMDTIKTCQPGDEIIEFMGIRNLFSLLPREFADFYIAQRMKKKIRVKFISPKFPEAIEALQTEAVQLRESRIVEDESMDMGFQADLEVYRNKVMILSYTENFIGVIIESREISDLLRAVLELVWKALPKPTKYKKK
jgi:sugar-specific transcriptional regulator TrmB